MPFAVRSIFLLSAALIAGMASLSSYPFIRIAAAAGGNSPDVVAVVNGTSITSADLDFYARARGHNAPPRQAMINELVERELLYQAAVSKGVDKIPDLVSDIENQRRIMIANRLITDMIEVKQPSEDEMRKFYQQRIANQQEAEYKTRNIQVETEDQAKKIIMELDKGKKFANLAKQYSVDALAQQGGDLGWLGQQQMPEPFFQAVQGLEKGKYTMTPVKTDFGWHIILLEDKRTPQPPSFEDVKEQIRGTLQGQMISEYVASLRAKAKIEIK